MKKHLRLTIDFAIGIDESAISRDCEQDKCDYHDRQRRLLQAILSDQERLSQHLRYEAAAILASMSYEDWYAMFLDEDLLNDHGDASHAKILQPSINTLNKDDQTFFQECEKEGVLFENTEDVESCFRTEITKEEIEEVQV